MVQVITLPDHASLAAWLQRNQLSLTDGETHIWRLMLDHDDRHQAFFASICSPQEQERATRFYTPLLAARFFARRALLRCVLSLYTGDHPAKLGFSTLDHGKPILRDSDIQFNLSHSSGVALLGVTRSAALGVDIEAVQPIPDLALVAEHHFSVLERRELFSLPAAQQADAFYACWTRKEALIKADSRGLTIPLHDFDVTLLADDSARFRRIDVAGLSLADWHLHDVACGAGYRGALAQAHPIGRLVYFEVNRG